MMNRRHALHLGAAAWLAGRTALSRAAAQDRSPRSTRLERRDLSLADKPGAPDISKADLASVPMAAEGRTEEVRQWLLDCSTADMTHCTLDLPLRDAYLVETPWLSRAIAAYAYLRDGLASDERETLDSWFRRNAAFNQKHIDVHLAEIFPGREAGNYTLRKRDASSGKLMAQRLRQDGPQISMLSQWFNNRRSAALLFVMQAGLLLDEPSMIASTARYVREWVTYAVWPGGEQGEWNRNGDYGYVTAGLAYGASNITLALLSAMWMDQRGDRSLRDFSTTQGLFGTESPGKPKTIWTAFNTHVALLEGARTFRDERARPFDALLTPYGRPMHASWYLPAAHYFNRSAALDRWAADAAHSGQKLDDPFGPWRGMSGIFVDVRTA